MQTRTAVLNEQGAGAVEAVFRDLEAQARHDLKHEGVALERIVLQRTAGMRYIGQSWELQVSLPADTTNFASMEAAFADVHDRRFGHRSQGAVEIVTYRVVAIGRVDKLALPAWTVEARSRTPR